MNKEQLRQMLARDLNRPGAVSWLERNEFGNWRAICGAPDCNWACQAPARCPVHDEMHCYHVDGDPRDLIDVAPPRPMVSHWHANRSRAIGCLNHHLVKAHGWSREEVLAR